MQSFLFTFGESRDFDLLHPTGAALDPWHPGMEIRLVLEEVEMPPRPLQGVAYVRLSGFPAGTGELGPLDEVEPEVEPAILLGELEIDDLPEGLESPRARVNKPSSSIKAYPFKVGFASNLITATGPL